MLDGIPHSWYGLLAALDQQPDRPTAERPRRLSLSRLSNEVARLDASQVEASQVEALGEISRAILGDAHP